MKELFAESFQWHNFPATLLLLLCLGYWLFVILGALDLDAIDFGGSPEADLGLDAEAEVPSGGWIAWVMEFFNLVEIPAIVFLSISGLAWWFGQVMLDHFLNPGEAAGVGFGLLVASFAGSLFAAKAVTQPLRPFFRKLHEGEKHLDVIGQEGDVRTGEVTSSYGQVEVVKAGAPLLLNAVVAEGEEPVRKGERVLVYREDRERGVVLVKRIKPKTP